MYQYTLAELDALPTIHTGHTDDLKVQSEHERIWLSRLDTADGEPADNMVTVEHLMDGKWITVLRYPAEGR